MSYNENDYDEDDYNEEDNYNEDELNIINEYENPNGYGDDVIKYKFSFVTIYLLYFLSIV